jgi:hypothetical protein
MKNKLNSKKKSQQHKPIPEIKIKDNKVGKFHPEPVDAIC